MGKRGERTTTPRVDSGRTAGGRKPRSDLEVSHPSIRGWLWLWGRRGSESDWRIGSAGQMESGFVVGWNGATVTWAYVRSGSERGPSRGWQRKAHFVPPPASRPQGPFALINRVLDDCVHPNHASLSFLLPHYSHPSLLAAPTGHPRRPSPGLRRLFGWKQASTRYASNSSSCCAKSSTPNPSQTLMQAILHSDLTQSCCFSI